MEGMSEREYAAHSSLSRGAVQKARKTGRLVAANERAAVQKTMISVAMAKNVFQLHESAVAGEVRSCKKYPSAIPETHGSIPYCSGGH